MKLEFVYWRVYFENLNKWRKVNREWEEVKRIGKKFEKQYKSEINKIIRVIPKIVGKSWREKKIKVYIVDWVGPSFSHPLTLKIHKDLFSTLVILTHELLHQFYTKDFCLDEKSNEEKINKNVKEVFKKIGIEAEEQLGILQSHHKKRFSKASN